MLSLEDGRSAVVFARLVVESVVTKKSFDKSSLGPVFSEERGVFVTLSTFPDGDLRGCIGIPMPIMSLGEALVESGRSVVFDPRFLPLSDTELEKVVVEVSVLTPPQVLEVHTPSQYLEKIVIGRDGLIVEKGGYRGLLLPQVPVEWKWDVKTFLEQTCAKAGLSHDEWKSDDVRIFCFSAQIFSEMSPCGVVEERSFE